MGVNAERLTGKCNEALERAVRLASQRDQYPVGSLHLLAGLLGNEECIAVEALKGLGINLDALRQATMNALAWEPAEPRGERGWSVAAESSLDSALEAVSSLDISRYAGTEHLLIGLTGQEESPAARLLSDFGVQRDSVIEQVMKLLGRPKS